MKKAKIAGNRRTQRNYRYEQQEELHYRYAWCVMQLPPRMSPILSSSMEILRPKAKTQSRWARKCKCKCKCPRWWNLLCISTIHWRIQYDWKQDKQARNRVAIRRYQWFLFETIVFLGGVVCCLNWNYRYIKGISYYHDRSCMTLNIT